MLMFINLRRYILLTDLFQEKGVNSFLKNDVYYLVTHILYSVALPPSFSNVYPPPPPSAETAADRFTCRLSAYRRRRLIPSAKSSKNWQAEIFRAAADWLEAVKLMTGRRPRVPQSAPSSGVIGRRCIGQMVIGCHASSWPDPAGRSGRKNRNTSGQFTTANRCLRHLKQVKDNASTQKMALLFQGCDLFLRVSWSEGRVRDFSCAEAAALAVVHGHAPAARLPVAVRVPAPFPFGVSVRQQPTGREQK